MQLHIVTYSLIFNIDDNQFTILGNNIDELRSKWVNLVDAFDRDGFNGETGVWNTLFGNNKERLYSPEEIAKELSFDEAKGQLDQFNKLVINGKFSAEEYFNTIGSGNDTLKKYITTTDQQNQSVQGLVKASQDARNTQLAHNAAIEQGTLKAKAATLGMKALAIAGNMLAGIAISMAITGLIKGIDYLINKEDKLKENLEESVSAFNETTEEIKTLNSELKTTEERIAELQKLSDTGTISVADEAELETLKEQNKELAKQIALKQRQQIKEGKEALENAQELSSKTVTSEYDFDSTSRHEATFGKQVSPEEELQLAIDKYKWLKEELSKGDISDTLRKSYENELANAETRIDEMYAILDAERQAYLDLDEAGYALNSVDQNRLNELNEVNDIYLLWNHNLTQSKMSFEALNAEQQRAILLNRLLEQGLSQTEAQLVLGAISDTDLGDYWDKDFSFIPPELTDYASAEAYGKAYADAWLNGVKAEVGTTTKSDLSPFEQLISSPALSETRDKLIELSQLETISEENISGLEGYEELLALCGKDVDTLIQKVKEYASTSGSAFKTIGDLTTIDGGMDSLSQVYIDKMDGDGFVKSDLLSGLKDEFSDLSFFDEFINKMMDVNATAEESQKAFDKLATQYIDTEHNIANLTEANKEHTIRELESLGVTNAKEAVEERLASVENNRKIILDVLNSSTKVSNIAKQRGIQTSNDLANATWQEIDALADEVAMTGADVSAMRALVLQKKGVNETTLNTTTDVAQLVEMANAAGLSTYALTLFEQALNGNIKDAGSADKIINETKEKIKNALTDFTIDYDYKFTGGGSSGGGGGDGDDAESKFSQIFDWIERRIKHFQTQFDRWLKQAETALTSGKIEKYYNKVAKQLEGLMDTYSKGYNKYMKLADKVDLDEEYKEKVRTGKISLETIKDEDLASKIEEYQEYYDKAQEYLDSYTEQAEKLANIPLDKAATKIERLNEKIELLDAKIDNTSIDNYKKANELIDKEEKQQKKILDANEKAEKQSAKNLESARKSLLTKSNLGKDDGITEAEKKKIKEAVKNGKEVDLSFFKEGSSGYKAALKYNEMLKANAEAIQEAALAQEEYNAWLEESAGQKFENIQTYYEKQVELLQAQTDEIQNQIDLLEARGQSVTAKYYQDQIGLEKEKLEQYELERKELEKQLQATEKLGLKGTETWYEMKAALADLNTEINESNINIAELNKSITELADKAFKKILEIRNLNTEVTDWAVSLMDNMQKFYEGTAIFSKEGMSELYAYVNGYKNSSSNSDDYKRLIEDLVSKYNSETLSFTDVLGQQRNYNSLEEFKDAIDNVYADWREQISTTYDYENKVVDMMRKKLEQELAIMKELIDSKKDALNTEKDLHDYQASIQESTQNIGSLQKQIAAVQGDTSEEGVARIQQLQSELSEAQKDLEDNEYDRYISDQQNMLDKMSQEYSDLIASEMNDVKGLLQDGLAIMSNINTVLDAEGTIGKYFAQYNYEPNETKEPETQPETTSSETQPVPETSTPTPTTQPTGSIPVPITIKPDGSVAVTGGTLPIPEETKGFVKASVEVKAKSEKDKALEFIDNNVKKAEKEKKEYSDVNKKIYSLTSGKILSSANLKKLTKIIGVDYDDATKNGKLYKKLKSLGVKGFRHGGIGRLIKENGEDGIAMVRNGEGFIAPEDVPQIQSLIDTVPLMNDLTKSLTKLPDMSHIKPILDNINTGNIEAYYNFTLENCSNPADIIRAIQTDSNVRKALQEVTVNQLHKNASRLSVNKYK